MKTCSSTRTAVLTYVWVISHGILISLYINIYCTICTVKYEIKPFYTQVLFFICFNPSGIFLSQNRISPSLLTEKYGEHFELVKFEDESV